MKRLKMSAFLFLVVTHSYAAGTQDELKRLSKCYTIFVNERIQSNDPLWIAVEQGSKTGTQACMEVLESASLGTDGAVRTLQNGDIDPVAMKVMKNMLFFYKAQFKVPDYGARIGGGDSRTMDVIDSNEPAYHYMYSLLKPDEQFSKVLTRDFSLRALRLSNKTQRQRSIATNDSSNLWTTGALTNAQGALTAAGTADFKCRFLLDKVCEEADATSTVGLTTAQLNTLNLTKANCAPSVLNNIKLSCSIYMLQGNVTYKKDDASLHEGSIPNLATNYPAVPFYPTVLETGKLFGLVPETTQNLMSFNAAAYGPNNNINGHYGAGILGSQAYIMGNVSLLSYGALNGGTKLQRRFGENILADFLCRKNPALRTVDVVNEVKAESSIPFRKGISCMKCHSGMDPLSGVARNFNYQQSHNAGVRNGKIAYMGKVNLNATQANKQVLWAENNNFTNANDYRNAAPIGRLYYRGFDGTLVKEEVSDIVDLGEVIAQKDDFYACTAKRHFKFLTGIDVNLDDSGDIGFPKLSQHEKLYRDRVIQLGKKLKDHQSLKELMKAIIESPTFIHPDRGV